MPGFSGPGPFLPDGNGPPGSGIPYNPPNGDESLFPNNLGLGFFVQQKLTY